MWLISLYSLVEVQVLYIGYLWNLPLNSYSIANYLIDKWFAKSPGCLYSSQYYSWKCPTPPLAALVILQAVCNKLFVPFSKVKLLIVCDFWSLRSRRTTLGRRRRDSRKHNNTWITFLKRSMVARQENSLWKCEISLSHLWNCFFLWFRFCYIYAQNVICLIH